MSILKDAMAIMEPLSLSEITSISDVTQFFLDHGGEEFLLREDVQRDMARIYARNALRGLRRSGKRTVESVITHDDQGNVQRGYLDMDVANQEQFQQVIDACVADSDKYRAKAKRYYVFGTEQRGFQLYLKFNGD